MKLSQVRNIPSESIKCIALYNNHVVCGLHTGTLMIFPLQNNNESVSTGTTCSFLRQSRNIQISKLAIRSIAVTSNLIVASDDGALHFLDTSFKRLKSVKMHNDFIRKVLTTDTFIFTCSDDFLIKKLDMSHNNEITVLRSHEHFVMDMEILDTERLVSCSLDMTIKIWNYKTNLCLMTLTGHTKGINTLAIDFCDSNSQTNLNKLNSKKGKIKKTHTIYSAGDDLKVRIWQTSQTNTSRVIEIPTKKNINHLRVHNEDLYVGGEDGVLRVYDRVSETVKKSVNLDARIWCTLFLESSSDLSDHSAYTQNYLLVGTDTGLMVYETAQERSEIFLTSRGVLLVKDQKAFINDKQALQLKSKVESVTSNRKMFCVQYKNSFTVFSYLGYREKMSGSGEAVLICSENEKNENEKNEKNLLITLSDGTVTIFDDLEKSESFTVPFDRFVADEKFIVVYCAEGCAVYEYSGTLLRNIETPIDKCEIVGDKLFIFYKNGISIYGVYEDELETVKVLKISESGVYQEGGESVDGNTQSEKNLHHFNTLVYQAVLYVQYGKHLFYVLPSGHFSTLSLNSGGYKLIGVNTHSDNKQSESLSDKLVLTDGKTIVEHEIDPIVQWQQCVLSARDTNNMMGVLPGRQADCLSFLLLNDMLEIALATFNKFEVYVEMADRKSLGGSKDQSHWLSIAFTVAVTPSDFELLGKRFLSLGKYKKAKRCYDKSGDKVMAEICAVLSGGKSQSGDSFISILSQIAENDSNNEKIKQQLKPYFTDTPFYTLLDTYYK